MVTIITIQLCHYMLQDYRFCKINIAKVQFLFENRNYYGTFYVYFNTFLTK